MTSRLATDLAALASRRRAMGLAALGLGGLAAACQETVAARTAKGEACLLTPTEIRGPFPADGTRAGGQTLSVLGQQGLIRQDIRGSFAGMEGEAPGVLLDCAIRLVSAQSCAPLAGRALYLWQCDAAGDYSLYNRREVNWLRGMQASDADGVVRFTTIVPGCYGGRAPHVHIELFESLETATSGHASLLVSQLAFTEAECAEIYGARAEYGSSFDNLSRWPASRDFAFSGPEDERAAQTIQLGGNPEKGYTGTATVTLG
ncbi:MAG TPA: intradiol ring-cleavage dioxygenase [Sphingomonadaceae bacterium]|nr:intradiol ring-cleavage dioxygenase [Sphingomonadaceae bacterium]